MTTGPRGTDAAADVGITLEVRPERRLNPQPRRCLMRVYRSRILLLIGVTLVAGSSFARADIPAYAVDILSNENYPQLRDAWMFRINNQGLAAGYVATASSTRRPLAPAMTG